MKRLFVFLAVIASSSASALHVFTVCYSNQTKANVSYNNEGVSHKWKSRGELIGAGDIAPGQQKCFGGISDETIFTKDYVTFYVNNKWVGIVNSGFAKPYIIAQDAQAKKGGKLIDNTQNGKDNYLINILVTSGGLIYSGSRDMSDQSQLVTPRTFN